MTTNNNEAALNAEGEAKEVTPPTPEVKTDGKTTEVKMFTPEQVESMLKKQRDKSKAKAEEIKATNEELNSRLEKIEAERALEKAEAETRAEIAKELAKTSKENGLKAHLSTKVLEQHVDRFMKLTLLESTEEDTIETLSEKADKLISEFPGVEKAPKVAAGATLNKAESKPEEKTKEKEESGYYTLNGTKLDYTDEQYEKLSYVQKQNIKVVK